MAGFNPQKVKKMAPIWHQRATESKKLSVPDGI